MLGKFLVLALAATPLVAAHGKVAVITGDKGGNTTALAIKGAVVPGPGPNSKVRCSSSWWKFPLTAPPKTEVDTTVFKKTNIQTDGLGRTTGSGKNKVNMLSQAMALSGDTLPQVSPGGSLSGVFHIVTTDGAGPISAVVDSTATGKFSQGTLLKTTTQVPGNKGNIKAPKKNARDLVQGALESVGLVKRAAKNVNQDFVCFFLPCPAWH